MLTLDTGAFVAATLADDPDHTAFAQLLADHPGPLVTCEPVVTEAAFLLDRIAVTEQAARFISELATSDVKIEPMARADLFRIASLLTSYMATWPSSATRQPGKPANPDSGIGTATGMTRQ